MVNITRNLFYALTVVCIVALIVYIVQFFVINRDAEPVQTGSLASGGASGNEAPPTTEENPFEGYEPPSAAPRPPPDGKRWEILIDTGTYLVIYAPEDKFNFVENEFDWRFQFRSGGSAALVVKFEHLLRQGAGDAAEAFLNRHVGVTNADYKGLMTILDSSISGYNVSAQNGAVTYDAWLHRLGDSDLALAFIINYEFSDQRDDLYEVLSSISIEQG